MTRFGVMKHLRLLEEAGLVTTRRVGRRKLHYLNPVPIRLVHDRWISRYSEPIVAQLSALKAHLEEEPMGIAPRHVYEIFIRTTPERLWRAITDPADTRLYYFGTESSPTGRSAPGWSTWITARSPWTARSSRSTRPAGSSTASR